MVSLTPAVYDVISRLDLYSDVFYTLHGRLMPCTRMKPLATLDVKVHYRLRGGKGGFGSMLRFIGSQIEKTTNREACRDLTGRRMRDVNNEKRLQEWLSKAGDRERERLEKQLERRRRRRELLAQGPISSHVSREKMNKSYKQLQQVSERISQDLDDAISVAISLSRDAKKKSHVESSRPPPAKVARRWMDADSDVDDDEDEQPEQQENDATQLTSAGDNQLTGEDDLEDDEEAENALNFMESAMETLNKQDNVDDEQIVSPDDPDKPCCSASLEKTAVVEQSNEIGLVSEESAHCPSSLQSSEVHIKIEAPPRPPPVLRDLSTLTTVDELCALGLVELKEQLQVRGLKCGGTLQERAERLWRVKDLEPSQYPVSLKLKAVPEAVNVS